MFGKISKLSVKIGLFVNTLMILALVGLATILSLTQRSKIRNEILDRAGIFADFTAASFYQTFTNNRFDYQVEPILKEALSKNPDITEVELVSINGKIQFNYKSENGNSKYEVRPDTPITDQVVLDQLNTGQTLQNTFTENNTDFIEIIVPIFENSGAHIFSMRYIASLSSLTIRTAELYQSTAIAIIPILAVVTISTLLLSIQITRPLVKLTQAIKQISNVSFNTTISIKTNDEIGVLAQTFNQMVQNLRTYKKQIETYNKTLENQVNDRTRELQEKVDELERFNKLTIDRELKIIELKNEIAGLKKDKPAEKA
jgi:methyl-accepting chemotaxis protein